MATDKDIDTTVEKIKEFLRDSIGSTWAEATAESDDNKLELDLATWGGSRYARREAPWEQMAHEMDDYREDVEGEITKMCRWHKWSA